MSRPKYRPVLTHAQITHLISLCKNDMSSESVRCISVLAPFEYKIQNRSVIAAYDSAMGLGESTGLGPSFNDVRTPIELYHIWLNDKTLLSVLELETVAEYRFGNDLMTAEEETQYQNQLISSPQKA